MSTIDWRLLEAFRQVGRYENVSRAARELGVSQPALSRSLGRFEAKVGAVLFRRVGRSLHLTPQGSRFLKAVERAFSEIEEAQAELSSSPKEQRPIRVGFVRTLGVRIVPELVMLFQRDFGETEFSFVSNNAPTLEEQLQKGDLDLVFSALPPLSPTLSARKVADQELVLIGPKNCLYAKRRFVALDDLREESFVTFKRGHVIRSLADLLCNSAGFSPHVTFEGEHSSDIPGFVAAGLGFAIVPKDGYLPEAVVMLKTRRPLMVRHMGLLWNDDAYLHAPARAFKTFVLESTTE